MKIYETYVPISEKYATLSFISLAPTLMAEGAALGEPRHALQPRREINREKNREKEIQERKVWEKSKEEKEVKGKNREKEK